MSSDRRANDAEGYAAHQQAWESLPWYVNGTLQGDELERVERHVAGCVTCRSELKYLQRLGSELHATEELALSPERGLARALAEIEGRRRAVGRLTSWLGAAPAGLRLALAGQALAILLLAGALGWQLRPVPPPAFHTLAAEPAAAPPQARLRVVFDETLEEVGLRALLLEVEAGIVGGPSPTGVYTLGLPAAADGRPAAGALDRLRSHGGVRYVELVTR